MHTKLFLTKDELPLFEALDSKLIEGWSAEVVEECYEDAQDWEIRIKNFLPTGVLFDRIREAFTECKTEEEFELRIATFDFSDLDYDQILQVFFVLGTRVLSKMIQHTLRNIQNDEDIEGAMTLSIVRANMFSANCSACILP